MTQQVDTSYTAAPSWDGVGASVDPRLMRDRRYRLVLIGSKLVLDANGVGVLTFQPQVRILPRRLIVPTGTVGSLANLQVGLDPCHVSATPEPFEMFSEKADTGLFDGVVCEPNIKVTAQITGGTASATIYAGMVAFALDRGASLLTGRLMRQGVPSTSIAAGASAIIKVNPQKQFRPRRLAFDSTAANISGLIVTDFRIQNVPQFQSADPLPILCFSELSSEGLAWLDMDECAAAAEISISVTNTGGSTCVFGGVMEGDVALAA
jgi:hypothetical protein